MSEYKMRYKTVDLSKCPICKTTFKEGEPVVIDHLEKDNMSYILCKDCWRKKTVGKLLKEKGHIKLEDEKMNDECEDDKLWRYMDLSKFISLLMSSSLFFASPELFSDKYEGAYGDKENREKWCDFYLSNFRASMYTCPDNCWHFVDPQKLERDSKSLVESLINNKIPVFINCWHSNMFESEAMWNLYSQNVENAIAVQTTFGKLKTQLKGKAEIKKVKYIDYRNEFADTSNPYWCKRKSFEHEREVRAICLGHGIIDNKSIEIPVDLRGLIETVYISPYAPKWFYGIVKDIIKRYGYDFVVFHSEMNRECF